MGIDDWSRTKKNVDKLANEINDLRLKIGMLEEIDKKDMKTKATLALLNLKLFCKSIEIMNLTRWTGIENPNTKKRSL